MGTRQINVVVGDDQKSRWDQYADNRGESLSHIIRDAVENKIAGERSGGDVPDDLVERLSDIEQQNERLANLVENNERRLVNIESAVQEPGANIRDLANQILDTLPESRGEAEHMATRNEDRTVEEPYSNERVPTTVDDLADELDEQANMVAEAIEMLETGTHMIQSSENNGTTYYWRES